MTTHEIEDLYLRSLDETLTANEKETLSTALKNNAGLAAELSKYKKIREATLRNTSASFGLYFAKKVIAKIQNAGIQIDLQILAFFKKYQLAALGTVAVLLALNAAFADQLNLQSLFGLEDAAPATEEIVSFDYNQLLNADL